MASRSLAAVAGRVAIVLVVSALAGSSAALYSQSARGPTGAAPMPAVMAPARAVGPRAPAPLTGPDPLTDGTLGLRAGPVAVPLELRIPSLGVAVDVLGVGITAKDVMDAPMGPARDPVWQQAFWYRGSAVPGTASTALVAGHVSDSLGRPAVFASVDRLGAGDLVVVRDTRSGVETRFSVTDVGTYSLDQASDPAVLARIYGAGPVAGTGPQPSADGLAHLTLITCAGAFRNGTHDHRLVVYATRTA